MDIFSERTNFSMALAKEVGKEIKRILHNEDIHTASKGLNDVVTIADTTSEEIIVNRIKDSFPDDTIIAEEGGNYKVGSGEYLWAIDPLDGTMNYSRGIPYYCVSIGYMKNNHPIGGAIYIPELDELYYCEMGKGAYCNDKRIAVSNIEDIKDSLATIGFNNRYPEARDSFNRIHDKGMYEMQNIEKLFSTVISLCYVASGKIEAHFELNCFLWDICVGSLLVEESGGKCSSLNYTNIDYTRIDRQTIIATNKKIHNEFENLINKEF